MAWGGELAPGQGCPWPRDPKTKTIKHPRDIDGLWWDAAVSKQSGGGRLVPIYALTVRLPFSPSQANRGWPRDVHAEHTCVQTHDLKYLLPAGGKADRFRRRADPKTC